MSCNFLSSVIKILIVFTVINNVYCAKSNGCHIKLSGDDEEKFEPIFYNKRNDLNLIKPKEGVLQLSKNQNDIVACPGAKNLLVNSQNASRLFACESKNQLQCEKIVRGDVETTNQSCGYENKGKILKIGYKVGPSNFLPLFEICYNPSSGVAFYSQHTIYGEEIKYASKTNYRPGFSEMGMAKDIPSIVYKRTYQKSAFNHLLNSPKLAEKYINGKSFLARGHLSPDADFLLAPWQFTTYYYVNVVPQWQAINNGNWKSVESTIRKAADKLKDTFTVFTGSHKVLQLPSSKEQVEVYLASKNRMPVPKYVWKLIFSENTSKGIVFVSINNPFIDEPETGDVFCKDICKETGWMQKSWANSTKGFIFCCDVKNFSKYVTISADIKVKGTLNSPL